MDKDSRKTEIISQEPLLAERFQVVALLGDGAAGAVYRVRDHQKGGAEVALKILTHEDAFDENTLQRFIEELHICQRVRHPNIVEAYDYIELEDRIAFTMEFVNGSDLSCALASRKLDLNEIDDIFSQFLSGLEALHNHGIVHRDLKLENVLLREDGVVKISDLGLMKQLWQDNELTRTGILLGTPQYLPPEYLLDGNYDTRGDLYSCGILLYELLTKDRYLAHLSGMKAVDELVRNDFELPELDPDIIPDKHRYLVARATERNPEDRFQSAGEMRSAVVSPKSEEIRVSLDSILKKRHYSICRRAVEVSKSRPALVASVALFFTVLCLGMYSLLGNTEAKQIQFLSGSYRGEINMFGNTGYMKPVEFLLTEDQPVFKSDLDNCAEGEVDVSRLEVHCVEGRVFRIELSKVSDTYFSGYLRNPVTGKAHSFFVSR